MKKLLKNITFSLITTLLALLILLIGLELSLRIFTKPPITPGYTQTHPTRRYELKPNFSGKTYSADVKINSSGIRDKERKIIQGDKAYRIGIFGDSYTFGHGVASEETFPKILEDSLNQLYEAQILVFNFGVPSYNTVMEYLHIKDVYDVYKLHLIIVVFICGNDTYQIDPVTTLKGINNFYFVRLIKDLLRNLYSYNWLAERFYRLVYIFKWEKQSGNEMQARLRHDNQLYADDFKGWGEAQKAFGDISTFCKTKNSDLIFAIIANNVNLSDSLQTDPWYNVIQKIIKALQNNNAKNILLLDEAYRQYAGDEKKLWVREYDSHYSPLAHKLAADYMFDYIRKEGFIK